MYKGSSTTTKNMWVFIILLLAGVVIGGAIGEYLGNFSFLSWLKYGKEFGLTSPLALDLGILKLQFALSFKFTISGIIGIIIAIIAFKNI